MVCLTLPFARVSGRRLQGTQRFRTAKRASPKAGVAPCGGQVTMSGSVSSQYLTALLMAAPLATGGGGIEITITDELVSQPYVDMTIRLMERFGVQAGHRRPLSSRTPSHLPWPLLAVALADVRCVPARNVGCTREWDELQQQAT